MKRYDIKVNLDKELVIEDMDSEISARIIEYKAGFNVIKYFTYTHKFTKETEIDVDCLKEIMEFSEKIVKKREERYLKKVGKEKCVGEDVIMKTVMGNVS